MFSSFTNNPPELDFSGSENSIKRAAIPSLTGLRFIAAMAVIFRHFGVEVLSAAPPFLARQGQRGFLAVSFFFCLSGFVLSYSCSNPNGRGIKGTLYNFYVARFSRIYPAYLLAVLASLPMFYKLLREVHDVQGAAVRAWIGSAFVLTLLQAWLPWTAGYVNSPAWSLSVEAFFYLTFPFILRRISGIAGARLVGLLVVCWLIAIAPPLAFWMSGASEERNILARTIQCTPIFRLPEFIMGCITARLLVTNPPRNQTSSLRAYSCLLAIIVIIGSPLTIPELLMGNGLMAPLFCSLIWCAASDKGSFSQVFGSKILVFLGEISYAIYILQEPVARWFDFLLSKAPSSHFFSFTILLLMIAAATFLTVEQPSARLMRRLLGGRIASRSLADK